MGVDRALIERSHLELVDCVRDNATARLGIGWVVEDAVLGEHLGDECALGDDLQLSGSQVDVRSVEAAWPEEANGHAGARADEGRECLPVGGDEISSLSTLALLRCIVKVELEVLVLGNESETISCGVGEEELRGETQS